SRHVWQDGGWMNARAQRNDREAPIAIYEVHLGSWRRPEQGRYLSYRELAEQLVPYVADLGFTHIEVMPITEYPFDGSWGYQPISLFAPTSRHGGPDDCRAFIDACHRAGLGLWLDWVPGHFPTDAHGLGFGFKWNMGWMHDTLRYMSMDPIHRKYHHNDMTFGLLYAFHENFILPLSHDEVVHGKGSLLGRMPGDRWQRFANLRAYFAFMWTHPGKKLLFMGGEFGQEHEWNHDSSLDW